MLFLKQQDTSVLEDFMAQIRAQRLEREQAAARYYNFDFSNDTPGVGRFEWTPSSRIQESSTITAPQTPLKSPTLESAVHTDEEVADKDLPGDIDYRSAAKTAPVRKSITKRTKKGRRIGTLKAKL